MRGAANSKDVNLGNLVLHIRKSRERAKIVHHMMTAWNILFYYGKVIHRFWDNFGFGSRSAFQWVFMNHFSGIFYSLLIVILHLATEWDPLSLDEMPRQNWHALKALTCTFPFSFSKCSKFPTPSFILPRLVCLPRRNPSRCRCQSAPSPI